MANEPAWLTAARAKLGVREVVGPKHSLTIMGWIKKLGPKILGISVNDDETAWCGTFAAQCVVEAGLTPPPIAVRASSWGSWGRQLNGPRLGCILVFTRTGGGHVGFMAGHDKDAYHVLGGNQGNAVSITRIAKGRLAAGGLRWPHGVALPPAATIPFTTLKQSLSENEA